MRKGTRYNKKLARKPNTIKTKRYIILTVLIIVIAIGAVAVYNAFAGTGKYIYDSTIKKPSGRLFSDDSPINQILPSNVQYLGDSTSRLNTITPNANASIITWSWPIFDATIDTPKATVFCTQYGGQCPDITKSKVPVPIDVTKQKGSDGHVTIIDNANRLVYDYAVWKNCFLQPNLVQANWCPDAGGAASIDGNAIGGGTNVAKLAGGAGIIRIYEIQQGSIDHALVFGSNNTCAEDFILPAISTDGKSTDKSTCLKIGSRIQLDPNIKLDNIKSPYQKMIAKALQQYGAYLNDSAGTMGFYTEQDRTASKDAYQKVGVPSGADYYKLDQIPWSGVKIIKPQWNKDGSKAYAWGTGDAGVIKQIGSQTNSQNTPPTVPTNLIATGTFNTSLVIGWGASSDPDGIAGYKVYLNDKQIASTQAVGYILQGLYPSTTYKVSVSAYDTKGAESSKNTVNLKTKAGCFIFSCW